MKTLVTGGAGFIGSHLCERLLRDGHRLTIVDDLNDYYSPDLKRGNLAIVAQAGHYDFHEADISNTDAAMKIVAEARPDAIIHMAARAGVRASLEQPLLFERVNFRGT